MKVGIFDSGLGGLTVVSAITEIFRGADVFYIADTKYAPYGEKTQELTQADLAGIAQLLKLPNTSVLEQMRDEFTEIVRSIVANFVLS